MVFDATKIAQQLTADQRWGLHVSSPSWYGLRVSWQEVTGTLGDPDDFIEMVNDHIRVHCRMKITDFSARTGV
jgi:hypothetical protein